MGIGYRTTNEIRQPCYFETTPFLKSDTNEVFSEIYFLN